MPQELARWVSYVDNLTSFPRLTTPTRVSLDTTAENVFPQSYTCSGIGNVAVTPKVLAARYKTNGPLTYSEAKGSMSVAEFQGQMYDQQNQLDHFNEACMVNATVDRQVGSNYPSECDDTQQTACTESQLDIE